MEEEQRINVFNLRSINQVMIQTLRDPPVIYNQNDMAIHDFDREMVNASIELDQYLMVDSLIGNKRVSMTKKGYATITNESHHLVTPKPLTKEWGIGLEKEK